MPLKQLLPIFVLTVAGSAADLSGVSSIYIMPMTGGMDQYIALRLTRENVAQVVTDPQKADAVLTDRIGGGFDERWKKLYPDPEVKKDDKDNSKDVFTVYQGTSQGISRGRGAYFLIDRKTRNVIWSTYARSKSTQPNDANHTADQIAKDLAKARKPAAKQ